MNWSTMKVLIMLSGILSARAAAPPAPRRGGLRLKEELYDKQILDPNCRSVEATAVDHKTDTLFYSYHIHGKFEGQTGSLNLKTNESRSIDVYDVICMAIDSENRTLYLGSERGVYTYNIDTHEAEFAGVSRELIWSIFFKDDVLYYAEMEPETLYTFSIEKQEKFIDLENTNVQNIVLDDDNNLFFSNYTGLYELKKGSQEPVTYRTFSDEQYMSAASALAVDLHGNVYAAIIGDGLYALENGEVKMNIILDGSVATITFDSNNNLIYTVAHSKVLMLIPSNNTEC